jgi:hypothetical protein
MKRYRVAARAAASVLIRKGEEFSINSAMDGRNVVLKFRTRYLDRGYSVLAPGDLCLDAEGEAESIDAAATKFTNAGRNIAMLIAVACNARIGPLEPEVVFDSTPGAERRDFVQRYMAEDEIALTSRFANLKGLNALVTALVEHSERDRLIRAASQYNEALNLFRNGSELLVVEHLFMGAEAIKKAAWRHEIAERDITKVQLADEWGYDKTGKLNVDEFLDAEARLRLVFARDSECHKLAKHVSDHFEHGFSTAGALFAKSRSCLIRTASHLRNAIFEILKLQQDVRSILERYRRPRGPLGTNKYVRAVLVGGGDGLAAEGQEYPMFDWHPHIRNLKFDATNDRYSFDPADSHTARIGPHHKFENIRCELWDLSAFSPSENGPQRAAQTSA